MAKMKIPVVVIILLVAILLLQAPQRCCCQASMPPPSSSLSSHQCRPDQSNALLQLKNSSSFLGDGHDKMASWEEGVDCCLWEGVTCDSLGTGRVVVGLDISCNKVYIVSYQVYVYGMYLEAARSCRELQGTLHPNNFISHFPHLRSLNLANNNFSDSIIPSSLAKLTSLTHLNLSSTGFTGQIPSGFSHLNKLVSLDLSYNLDVSFGGDEEYTNLIANATELTELRLQGVVMSNIKPSSFSNVSHSLKYLDLSECELAGDFPESVLRLPHLEVLRLYGNNGLSIQLPQSNWSAAALKVLNISGTNYGQMLPTSIGNLKSLSVLTLDAVGLIGPVPSSISNLTSLTFLDLSFNSFSGRFPRIISNLVQLETLRIQGTNFSESFSVIFGNLTQQLTELSVSRNNFSGYIPSSIFNLPKLRWVDCLENQLVGPLPSEVPHGSLSDLQHVNLASNILNGTIPSWLAGLPSLRFLSLANNQLTGEIPELQSSSLEQILLHQNQLSGPVPNSIFKFVNIIKIRLESNKLTGVFLLENLVQLKNLIYLSLSDNHISVISDDSLHKSPHQSILRILELSSCNITTISTYFLESHPHLKFLNLSHNFLSTINIPPRHMEMLEVLDLSYNSIQGPLSIPWSPQLRYLTVAHNKLTGTIPFHICHFNYLYFIDLSNNNLSGRIPDCLANLTELCLLNLRMNNFHGPVPAIFGNMSFLENLELNGNRLGGPLPQALAACTSLEVLDVGNNGINDVFPQWLMSSLPQLKVLILHSNHFHGPITMDANNSFPLLRILDLSNNYFNGRLPAGLFHQLPAMTILQDGEKAGRNDYIGGSAYDDYGYEYSVVLTVKGYKRELEKVLTVFTTVDLSNNRFRGQIPDTIGELKSLLLLNLSHNSFVGSIPSSLGNLSELESLDLSSNHLTGEIPSQLASLNYLGKVNLSQNSLQGSIPQGRHFDTFDNTSYAGNEGLCGVPLSKKCGGGDNDDDDDHEDSESGVEWFDWTFAGAGYGCGLVIGISTAYIMFNIRKPRWLVDMVESWIGQREARRWRRPITF